MEFTSHNSVDKHIHVVYFGEVCRDLAKFIDLVCKNEFMYLSIR